jgi:hypothetical protein
MVKRPSESVTVPIVEFSTEILAPLMGTFVCALITVPSMVCEKSCTDENTAMSANKNGLNFIFSKRLLIEK